MEMESSSPVHTRPIGFRSLSVYPPRVRREHSAPRPRRGKGFAPAFAESPPDAGTLRLVFRFAPVHGEYAAMDGTPLRIRRPFCPQPSSSNARWHHTGGSRDRNDPHPQPARLRRRRYPAACLPARDLRARTVSGWLLPGWCPAPFPTATGTGVWGPAFMTLRASPGSRSRAGCSCLPPSLPWMLRTPRYVRCLRRSRPSRPERGPWPHAANTGPWRGLPFPTKEPPGCA